MHEAIMSDVLAFNLGKADRMFDNPITPCRDCNQCGYNIPNGEPIYLVSWIPLEVLTEEKPTIHIQWKSYHVMCMVKKAMWKLSKIQPNFQLPEHAPDFEAEIDG